MDMVLDKKLFVLEVITLCFLVGYTLLYQELPSGLLFFFAIFVQLIVLSILILIRLIVSIMTIMNRYWSVFFVNIFRLSSMIFVWLYFARWYELVALN